MTIGINSRLLASVMPAALAIAALNTSGVAHAQQAGSSQLEEIVVTSEKRVENIQQVPIAVTAFSGQALQDKAINDVHSLGNLTPNVNLDEGSPFSGSSSVLSASIRGIGQDDFAFNLDPGVGIYVDGIYYARTVGANQNLLDVERVEVLKGPQGTLFGRNTIGGAISVVTRTPGDKFTFEGQVTTGSLDRRDISATADVPITDNLRSSITISSLQRDGYQKLVPYPGDVGRPDPASTFNEADYYSAADTKGGQNQQTIRTKFLYLFSDALKFTFTADWTHEDESATADTVVELLPGGGSLADVYNLCIAGVPLGTICQRSNEKGAIATLAPGQGFVPYPQPATDPVGIPNIAQTGNIDTTYATGNNFSKLDSFGGAFTIDWTLTDHMALKSITGYRRVQWKAGVDNDGSPLDIAELSFKEGQHQTSQEIQLIGDAIDNRLNYVAGVYYFNEGGFIHDFVVFPAGLLQVDGLNTLDTTSYAGFAHANYKVTDQIGITLGARYSYEHKEFEGGQTDWNGLAYHASGCIPPTASASLIGAPAFLTCQQALGFVTPGQPYRYFPAGVNTQNFYEFTPTAGAEYHFTEDLMTYFSWSKGFKSGGWTTRLSSPIASATQAEFGPEKAETYEIGAKSEWLGHRLVVNVAGFYTDYQDIQLAQQEGASPVTKNLGTADIYGTEFEGHALLGGGFSLNAAVGYLDAYYTKLDPSVGTAILLGFKLPKTPKWKVSLSPEYDYTLPNDATLRFAADYTHTSSIFNDSLNTPAIRRPTTDVINTSLSYVPADDRYEVVLGGTNITNDRYLTTGQINPSFGIVEGTYSAPAEWYATLRVKFQGSEPPPPYTAPAVAPPAEPPPAPAVQSPEVQRSFQVFFDFDKADITDAAAKTIQAAADNIKAGHPTQIVVTGHTDTVGTAKYNQALSERRATAVKDALVTDGVEAGGITTSGVGKSGLLVPTKDGVREPQNRRAEIVLQ